ncbi:hypothetical protein LZG04_26935 [Saccharothrix sp. S26]|nr:hypothetical protein [Saccharothrix sp. S26]MCE6998408.1 hypothetical protein [Saccharothrix sp. S26]
MFGIPGRPPPIWSTPATLGVKRSLVDVLGDLPAAGAEALDPEAVDR